VLQYYVVCVWHIIRKLHWVGHINIIRRYSATAGISFFKFKHAPVLLLTYHIMFSPSENFKNVQHYIHLMICILKLQSAVHYNIHTSALGNYAPVFRHVYADRFCRDLNWNRRILYNFSNPTYNLLSLSP